MNYRQDLEELPANVNGSSACKFDPKGYRRQDQWVIVFFLNLIGHHRREV